MAGSRVIAEALARGHDVTAVFRGAHPESLPAEAHAVRGDATDVAHMSSLFADSDAIVAATRPAPGSENTVPATTTALLDATHAAGTRALLIGGSAPLESPSGGLVLDDPRYVQAAWRAIAASSIAQLDACWAHAGADWVYLSPPALIEPGTRTGGYRRGTTTLVVTAGGSSRISAEDFAIAAVDELESPGTERHFTVGY